MTGLDLESFLQLLRADLGAWASAGAIALLLALMTWTSWGSRRALRKCLGLSIAVHLGLVGYGATHPALFESLRPGDPDPPKDGIRQIRVVPVEESASSRPSADGLAPRRLAAWDRPREDLALADPALRAPRRESPDSAPKSPRADAPALEVAAADVHPPAPPVPGPRSDPPRADDSTPAPPAAPDEIASAQPPPSDPADPATPPGERLRLARPEVAPARPGVERTRPDAPDLPGALAMASEPSSLRPEPRADPPLAPPTETEVAPEPARPDGPKMAGSSDVAAPLPGEADLRRPSRPTLRRADTGPAPPPRSPIEAVPGGALGAPAVALASPAGRPTDTPLPDPERPPVLPDGPPDARRPAPAASSEPALARPEADVRRRARPAPATASRGPIEAPGRLTQSPAPIALARVVPSGGPRLPDIRGAVGGRPLADVPEIYRSRLDPNRSALARRAGATGASEQAVERALDWLARHQDADGGWDGKTARLLDGTPVPGDDDYTVHCPPGDVCPGECFYWEADTALTGLALLAYLGAGYTHTDGVYSDTVAKGLDYLILAQKPDGDLRGRSKAVGMYCHAMAALALCEAYALTADDRLRQPVERAVAFLVKAQAPNGMGWRYAPRAPIGDTSILGWAVLVLRSAKYAGIAVPATAEAGTLSWLDRVADGPSGGLARYQPGKPPTATMTAEAWVCRLFLGIGGRGEAGDEAARYLIARAPDRGEVNIYYWYYGTLAMYLHGGESWPRWNDQVRERLVLLQKTRGHQTGSWDPDASEYGSRGGRIYQTALSALTLEVYYRYLRLYDNSASAPILAPAPERPADPTLRKAAGPPDPSRRWRKAP